MNSIHQLGENEHLKLKQNLHNAHALSAPYEWFRVWVCEECGWFTVASWHADAHNERLYRSVLGFFQPAPEPEPETYPDPEPEDIFFDEPLPTDDIIE